MPLQSGGIPTGGSPGISRRVNLSVSRSLTIKTDGNGCGRCHGVCFARTVLLFHLVQQNRYNTATQLKASRDLFGNPFRDFARSPGAW